MKYYVVVETTEYEHTPAKTFRVCNVFTDKNRAADKLDELEDSASLTGRQSDKLYRITVCE